MSEYEYRKVIRLPLDAIKIEGLDLEKSDWSDYEIYFEQQFKELWGFRSNQFDIGVTDKREYLDYSIEYNYDHYDEFGYSEYLTEDEKQIYKKLFDLGKFDYDIKDLRKVTYCFYNCAEPDDYYDIETEKYVITINGKEQFTIKATSGQYEFINEFIQKVNEKTELSFSLEQDNSEKR